MGIHSMLSFLAPVRRTGIDILTMKGRVVVIDAFYVLHQKMIGKFKHGSNVFNNDGEDITHIDIFLNYTSGLLERGIRPIYVFDSKTPVEKENTIASRKMKLLNVIDNETDVIDQELKKTNIIEYSKIQESIEFLKNIGVTVINSVGEADPDCAKIANMYSDHVCGVISNDSDMLLYNCPAMIDISFGENKNGEYKRDFKRSQITYSEYSMSDVIKYLDRKSNFYRKMNPENSEKHIEFTHENFVDFSIMLGTDYFYNNKKPNGIHLEYEDGTVKQCNVEHVEKLFKIFVLCECNVELVIDYISRTQTFYECDCYGKYKFSNLPTFMKIWNDTKEIYSNPTVTCISLEDVENYGITNFYGIEKYFGNISDTYKDIVIDRLLKIDKGGKIFKSILRYQSGFESWLSYRIKYNERKVKMNGGHDLQNNNLRTKLYDIFNPFSELKITRSGWKIVGK